MPIVQSGTVIGYDAATGAELFVHPNRAIRLTDGSSSLPIAGTIYAFYDKRYRVLGVRVGSTETVYKIDVEEE